MNMNFELKLHPDNDLYILDISGQCLPGDLIDMLKELWQNEQYMNLSHVIWDFTKSETNYYFNDIFKLFQFVKESKQMRGPHTLAVVAPHDTEFGMSRMYATLSETELPKVNVFRELAPAIGWLREHIGNDAVKQ
jgi:hypothetical protein